MTENLVAQAIAAIQAGGGEAGVRGAGQAVGRWPGKKSS